MVWAFKVACTVRNRHRLQEPGASVEQQCCISNAVFTRIRQSMRRWCLEGIHTTEPVISSDDPACELQILTVSEY